MKKSGRRGILLFIAGILFVALGIFVVWSLVQDVLARLRSLGVSTVTERPGQVETVVFQMPAELDVLIREH